MTFSRVHQLPCVGQSVWIDFLSREAIHGGEFQRLIEEDAVVGATSNPTIFEQAMSTGNAYDAQLRELVDAGSTTEEIFWALAQRDIGDACSLFAPVWERSRGRDGYVSLEVDPRLAYDTLGAFDQAMRLHHELDRPNLMVKIPATKPGVAAFEDVIAEGRSVNVTLIFSLARYAAVAESYLRGLERLVAAGGDPSRVASVASFFISRIDTETDRRLNEIGGHDHLKGRLAVANAKLAYRHFQAAFSGSRWDALAAKGARRQRVLWASTSTKNPAYPDTVYVDALAAPDTVNTMPVSTLRAFQDHGCPEARLDQGIHEAPRLLDSLASAGISYDALTETLEAEGVEKFTQSFEDLLVTLEREVGSAPRV